jgi:septal ring factor EnvC (AmiA/AmiB activator)
LRDSCARYTRHSSPGLARRDDKRLQAVKGFAGISSATSLVGCLALLALAATAVLTAQTQSPPPDTHAIDERIRALQKESSDLARQSQTLVGELRQLEIERDVRGYEAAQAQAASVDARQALERATTRLAALEQQRIAELPDLRQQLVDIYKRGRGGYTRLLASASGLRDFSRTLRAVAALAAINERRIAEHRSTLDALAAERAALERSAAELAAREDAARQAREAAERAVTARAALIARIDSRRDLTARYVGELQVAYDKLQQLTAAAATAPTGETVSVPLEPFRGALEWPVSGRVSGRFGQSSNRLGGTAVRNGLEIVAEENAPVRAVHRGTVGYADVFTGLGNLVIVDHGGNDYSIYGYLGTIGVERGTVVVAGAELGRVGFAPAGPPALYFEMRIDGRSVDPLQWLEQR